ncbi:hypothetical protein OG21DRAFT_1526581 [Imleria badia]|nr:hypothetical protein OG21DRAFT_1526581 [Imleria badia]
MDVPIKQVVGVIEIVHDQGDIVQNESMSSDQQETKPELATKDIDSAASVKRPGGRPKGSMKKEKQKQTEMDGNKFIINDSRNPSLPDGWAIHKTATTIADNVVNHTGGRLQHIFVNIHNPRRHGAIHFIRTVQHKDNIVTWKSVLIFTGILDKDSVESLISEGSQLSISIGTYVVGRGHACDAPSKVYPTDEHG